MTTISENLERISARIRRAALDAGRDPGSVTLVAVTKTHPAAVVSEALDAGHAVFGENYIQESREKVAALAGSPARWHFIGHLQTNKAKYAVNLFELVHSVDSRRLADALDTAAARIDKVQRILIQVNIAGEASKSGAAPEEIMALADHVAGLPHLALEGFMTMPPFFDDPERARPYFRRLGEIRDAVSRDTGVPLPHLSMGMTGDFEAAIAEGATLVRVGTAIFGSRR